MKPPVTGYQRTDSPPGIRNHILILPAVMCCNLIVQMAAALSGHLRWGPNKENRILAITHEAGCCRTGYDHDLALRVLTNTCLGPNVAHVVLVSLGCGSYCSKSGDEKGRKIHHGQLYEAIRGPLEATGRGVTEVVVQKLGDTQESIRQVSLATIRALAKIEEAERVPMAPSVLTLGNLNGASDPTSGLLANDVAGRYADLVVGEGGRLVFSQTVELLGAEERVLRRTEAATRPTLEKLLEIVTLRHQLSLMLGILTEPTIGNRRSGTSTLPEKAIATFQKIGRHGRIVGVVPHGSRIDGRPGLHLVDGPGQDVLAFTGLAAAGAHLLLFTTGMGTPTGSPIAPTIKLTANKTTYDKQRGDIDLYLPLEEVVQRSMTPQDVVERLLVPFVNDVISGKRLTVAEKRGQSDFQIRQTDFAA